jgi:hypothetical protein
MSEACVICVNPIDLAQSIDAASTIDSRFSKGEERQRVQAVNACPLTAV